MALRLFAQIGLITHLFSLLAPAVGPQPAALAMGLATTSAIAGRTLVGWVMPPDADRRVVASASYAVQIAGSIMFILVAGSSAPLLFLGVILFGAGIGNATSLPPLIAHVEFPERRRTSSGCPIRCRRASRLCPRASDLWSGQGIRPAFSRHSLVRGSGPVRRRRVCPRTSNWRIFAGSKPTKHGF